MYGVWLCLLFDRGHIEACFFTFISGGGVFFLEFTALVLKFLTLSPSSIIVT